MTSNLRPAPAWVTPELVERVLDVIEAPVTLPAPIHPVPVPAAKPTLRVVDNTQTGREQQDAASLARATRQARRHVELEAAREARRAVRAEHAALRAARRVEEREAARQARDAAREARATVKAPPKRVAWYEVPLALEAIAIADRRGIAVIDLAAALDKPAATVLVRIKALGFDFGKRPPLARPLILGQLLALADDQVPVPELRRDLLYRVRLEREAAIKRERRAVARATDPAFKPKGPRQVGPSLRDTPGASGTAREASGAASLGAAKRDSVSAPTITERSAAAPLLPASTMSTPARAAFPIEDGRVLLSLQVQRARRSQMNTVRERIAAGETSADYSGKGAAMNFRAVEKQLAEEARQACPIEQAKVILQRRGRVVYSMAVYGGRADHYFVSGLGKDVSAGAVISLATKIDAGGPA